MKYQGMWGLALLALLTTATAANADGRRLRPARPDPDPARMEAIASPELLLRRAVEQNGIGFVGAPLPGSQAEPDHGVAGRRAPGEVGGTDVDFDFGTGRAQNPRVQIASDGTVFAAFINLTALVDEWTIQVYRSVDSGNTFNLYGEIAPPISNNGLQFHDLCLAEGDVDRLYVQYAQTIDSGWTEPMVAYTDPFGVAASWTVQPLPRGPADHAGGFGALISDAVDYPGYYLYSTYLSYDLFGAHPQLYMVRSVDFGVSWSTPMVVAEYVNGPGESYTFGRSKLAYGSGAIIHVAFEFQDYSGGAPLEGLFYRRATSYADSPANWEPTLNITLPAGITAGALGSIAASTLDGTLVVQSNEATGLQPWIDYVSNGGSDWSIGVRTNLPLVSGANIIYSSLTDEYFASGRTNLGSGFGTELTRADPTDLSSWTEPLEFSDSPGMSDLGVQAALDVNPAWGGRVAVLWTAWTGLPAASFDAEWRGDAGFPTLEPGFPVALPAGGRTSPALVDIDGDGLDDIVFGDQNGWIRVYRHDGTIPAGWPQFVGSIPENSPVAVGDLNGNCYVVCGTTDGQVHALDKDGNSYPGFPVDLETAADTYVSIGALGTPYKRRIVACSGKKVRTINYAGAIWPVGFDLTGNVLGPAAIGDVDADGIAEIVTTMGPAPGPLYYIHVWGANDSAPKYFKAVADPINGPAALADMDLDPLGDLEIVVPTATGKILAFHHDGTVLAGFPWSTGSGAALTSVALADNIGPYEPEVFACSTDNQVHEVWFDGTAVAGFPAALGVGSGPMAPPIVTPVNRVPSNVIALAADQTPWSFDNFGSLTPGWPLAASSGVPVSPAAGDIDGDGSNEIVFLTDTELRVYDVHYPPESELWRSWPMFGYDAQRTRCLNCAEDTVTAAPEDPQPTRFGFASPAPNPSHGSLVFQYSLQDQGRVELEIFDVRGRRVAVVERGEFGAGPHLVGFDGKDHAGKALASGQYFARLRVQSGAFHGEQTQKFTLVR